MNSEAIRSASDGCAGRMVKPAGRSCRDGTAGRLAPATRRCGPHGAAAEEDRRTVRAGPARTLETGACRGVARPPTNASSAASEAERYTAAGPSSDRTSEATRRPSVSGSRTRICGPAGRAHGGRRTLRDADRGAAPRPVRRSRRRGTAPGRRSPSRSRRHRRRRSGGARCRIRSRRSRPATASRSPTIRAALDPDRRARERHDAVRPRRRTRRPLNRSARAAGSRVDQRIRRTSYGSASPHDSGRTGADYIQETC